LSTFEQETGKLKGVPYFRHLQLWGKKMVAALDEALLGVKF
jgi:hypothetical protein